VDHNRGLAHRFGVSNGGGDCALAGLLTADNFYQRHHVYRVEEVHTAEVFRTLQVRRQQVDGNGRGVGGDDGVFTNHIFHFTQNDVFNFRVLNNRFNYQVNGFEVAVAQGRSEEHTSELQSRENLVCRLLLEKKNNMTL